MTFKTKNKQSLNIDLNEELDLFGKSRVRDTIRVCYLMYSNTGLNKDIILMIYEYIYEFLGIISEIPFPFEIDCSTILRIEISPDGLIYILSSGILRIYKHELIYARQGLMSNFAYNIEIRKPLNNIGLISDFTFNNKVTCMMICDGRIFIGFEYGTISIWNNKQWNQDNISNKQQWIKDCVLLKHTGSITSITKLDNNGYDGIISTSRDKTIRIWNLETQECDFILSTSELPMKLILLPQREFIFCEFVVELFQHNIGIWTIKRINNRFEIFSYKFVKEVSKNKLTLKELSEHNILNLNMYKCIYIMQGITYDFDILPNGQIISGSHTSNINIWPMLSKSINLDEFLGISNINKEVFYKNGCLKVLNNGHISFITKSTSQFILNIMY